MRKPYIDKWHIDFYGISFRYNFGSIGRWLFYYIRLFLKTIENIVSLCTLGIVKLEIDYLFVHWYMSNYNTEENK